MYRTDRQFCIAKYIYLNLTVLYVDNSCDPEKESLSQEIELGKSLDGDRHPNIVNFLACVSTSGKNALVRLLKISYHNLPNFLLLLL